MFPKDSALETWQQSFIRLWYLWQNHVHQPQTMLVTMGTLLSSISIQLLCATIFTIFYIIKREYDKSIYSSQKDPAKPIIIDLASCFRDWKSSGRWNDSSEFLRGNRVTCSCSGVYRLLATDELLLCLYHHTHYTKPMDSINIYSVYTYERSSM